MIFSAILHLALLHLLDPLDHFVSYKLIGHASAEETQMKFSLDDGYPIEKNFGGIAGVDIDKDNNLIIFDRGSHKWDASTFNSEDIYMPDTSSPIPEDTVFIIDPKQKDKPILKQWGKNKFFMPHGLSLDQEGKNVWLTDVAMHQVFKYTLDGVELLSLGEKFVPGNDETHFCKPTSVADTGDFIFVADGYCNSRIAMFSSDGSYLGEFGQSLDSYSSKSSNQPVFAIPHKIIYSKEAKMLFVADRENGRIQCFSFEPNMNVQSGNKHLMLKKAINLKFIITEKAFNGRAFSVDYSPILGGILVAVSGTPLGPTSYKAPPVGLVFNSTNGDLISKFEPPNGKIFGMAHDIAITGFEAESVYVVDIVPVNLWKFSRPLEKHMTSRAIEITRFAGNGITKAVSIMRENNHGIGYFWAILLFSVMATFLFILSRLSRFSRHHGRNAFGSLSSNGYPTSVNSLFGNSAKFPRRSGSLISGMFSRGNLFNMINLNPRRPNDFNRIPLDESDNSGDDKSDSDVEEFNISQANPSVKINV